jgi:hypothetical protein
MLVKTWYSDAGMEEKRKRGNKTKQYGISPPEMVLISSGQILPTIYSNKKVSSTCICRTTCKRSHPSLVAQTTFGPLMVEHVVHHQRAFPSLRLGSEILFVTAPARRLLVWRWVERSIVCWCLFAYWGRFIRHWQPVAVAFVGWAGAAVVEVSTSCLC